MSGEWAGATGEAGGGQGHVTLPALSPGQEERHWIYGLMLMALIYYYWNGNKNGRRGEYPFNEKYPCNDGPCLDRDYVGHNIAAIAVDARGEIMAFDFNHNRLFNSSIHHAEARLIRRLFSLNQLTKLYTIATESTKRVEATKQSRRSGGGPFAPYTTLADVTVYTSLEPCAQCAGIMALARVREVVYLQTDQSANGVAQILYNLTHGPTGEAKLPAPLPRSGHQCGAALGGYFRQLSDAYRDFCVQISPERPFHRPGNADSETKVDYDESVTSFLCTKMARDIYGSAARVFGVLRPKDLPYRRFGPHDLKDREGALIDAALTNGDVLEKAREFLDYARISGQRGTPHSG
jgi:tRNA(Arg) A34 adenosine deaminase TadA